MNIASILFYLYTSISVTFILQSSLVCLCVCLLWILLSGCMQTVKGAIQCFLHLSALSTPRSKRLLMENSAYLSSTLYDLSTNSPCVSSFRTVPHDFPATLNTDNTSTFFKDLRDLSHASGSPVGDIEQCPLSIP